MRYSSAELRRKEMILLRAVGGVRGKKGFGAKRR